MLIIRGSYYLEFVVQTRKDEQKVLKFVVLVLTFAYCCDRIPVAVMQSNIAGWSSPVARWAHNPKVRGSNPLPATIIKPCSCSNYRVCSVTFSMTYKGVYPLFYPLQLFLYPVEYLLYALLEAFDECFHAVCAVFFHTISNMPIHIKGKSCRTVSERFLHCFYIVSILQH